jgi:hypothetical protein
LLHPQILSLEVVLFKGGRSGWLVILRKVPELTLVDDDAETAQHPTVSTVAIVPYITLRLTDVAKPAG